MGKISFINNESDHPKCKELVEQCNGGEKRYGGITELTELRANLADNCIPENVLDEDPPDYEDFLAERRKLMALKIKEWFEVLS